MMIPDVAPGEIFYWYINHAAWFNPGTWHPAEQIQLLSSLGDLLLNLTVQYRVSI